MCITGTSQLEVVAFILREKMPHSQRGITLWEHSKPVDLENNAVLIHVSITSLNINQAQTFQRSATASWQKLILWDQRVQKLSYAALCATIMADTRGFHWLRLTVLFALNFLGINRHVHSSDCRFYGIMKHFTEVTRSCLITSKD